jgi:murein DD-endopeptidase MepM/ murein hydrolase activator NlpD
MPVVSDTSELTSATRRPSPSRRRRRARVGRGVALVAALLVAGGALFPPATAWADCWRPPVDGVVVDPFREPPCRWCAGNRGLEWLTADGAAVRAAAAGVVTFGGTVAGTSYVVVRLANGWLLTYGRLATREVATGDPVVTGGVLGTTDGRLFFGLRVDGRYVDPARYLGELIGRPRLVPADGRAARPAPPPRLACARPAVR